MLVQEIPRSEWASFLEAFGRQHEGWLATVELNDPSGRLTTIEARPLRYTKADTDVRGKARIAIAFGGRDLASVSEIADMPEHVWFLETEGHAHVGLEIESAEGRRLTVRFRSPMLPEMLDGIAA